MIRFLLPLLAVCSLLAPVSAAPTPSAAPDFAGLDRYITAQMQKHGLQGIALAVTQGHQILYQKGYGTAGAGRPMTPETPMYIGSQSKSITGLAIAQLVSQGKIELTAPVRRYIPDFAVADPDASGKITVFDLLHHISGLSEAGYTTALPDSASLDEGVRSLASARLTAPIGSTFQYFNMGYCVLAKVVENASGMSYPDYVQQQIFAPLGMSRSFTDPGLARAAGLSQGYSRFFGFTVPWPQPHLPYQLGDGYLISTAQDLAHFAIALGSDGSYQGKSVLPAEKLSLLFAPVMGYGMGWFISPTSIYHGGANETFKTYVTLYPERGMGIVLLINQGYMLDHYISAPQVFAGVEAIVLGNASPAVSSGLSVRTIGWGLLAFVLGLVILHTCNIVHLRGWKNRAQGMSAARRALDVAVSFLIPTLILVIVYTQLRGFFGYRFNLTYQLVMMFKTLPDISILMIVGTLPDYLQGIVKLVWLARLRRGGQDRHRLPGGEALQV